MIRVYFVFQDPFDESEINMSFVDVPTRDPDRAFSRVSEAGASGELWSLLYPEDDEHPYALIDNKMAFIDVPELGEVSAGARILPI